MRHILSLIVFILLAACSSVVATPSLPSTVAKPTSVPTSPAPTPTTAHAGYDAALLPEFKNDLQLVHSPTQYNLNMRLDATFTHLSAAEAASYTNRTGKPLADLYFRLFPNFPGDGGSEAVTNVRVNGNPAITSMEQQDTALRVSLPQPLLPGNQILVSLNFSVTVPIDSTGHYSDFTDTDGVVTLPTVYPLIPAYDEKGWHTELPPPYGDLVYADSSLYDVQITAPTTATVIASGVPVDSSAVGNETTTHFVGGPMRDFDVNVSPILQKVSGQVDGIAITSYFLPQDQSGGRDALKWASDALRVYQQRIGPYPFKKLDVVETPTKAGGIEYPALVAIASGLYENPNQQRFFEFAVAHEVAHQWFYSVVGDDQVNTPWMDESLVQYCAYLYELDTYGPNVGVQVLDNNFKRLYQQAVKDNHDMAVGLPVASYTEAEYGEIVYGKGPLFYDAIRQQIGDSKFTQFLHTYYERFKYQIAKPGDVLNTLDLVSGQKLDALYDTWILGK